MSPPPFPFPLFPTDQPDQRTACRRHRQDQPGTRQVAQHCVCAKTSLGQTPRDDFASEHLAVFFFLQYGQQFFSAGDYVFNDQARTGNREEITLYTDVLSLMRQKPLRYEVPEENVNGFPPVPGGPTLAKPSL